MRAAFVGLPADAARRARAGRGARARVSRAAEGRRLHDARKPTARELGQRVTPLDRVGIYVPGGKAAYPSSVLMNAIPAHVAGVREIVMVVPTPDGVRNPLVLAAAHARRRVARVHDRRRAGDRGARLRHRDDPGRRQDLRPGQRLRRGRQAPRVRRRRHRHGRRRVGDRRGRRRAPPNPDWVALDLFSQAEHDEMAQAILLTPDAAFARPRRGERAPAARRDAARRHHRGRRSAARGALVDDARPRGGLRDRQPHRAGASRARGRRSRRAAAADPPRRRDLHRPLRVGGARRLLRRPEPRAADRTHRALLARRSASTTSRSARACCGCRTRRRRRSGRSPPRSRTARA